MNHSPPFSLATFLATLPLSESVLEGSMVRFCLNIDSEKRYIGQTMTLPFLKKGQIPFLGDLIMANDINGAIITKKLKIPVIRGKPPVKNFYHLNGVVADLDVTRCFLSPISGITIDFYVHTRHQKIRIRFQCYQNSLPPRDTEVNLYPLSQRTLSGFELSKDRVFSLWKLYCSS
jgi:hypothetical protein